MKKALCNKLGRLLKLTLLDRRFYVYERDAKKINVDELQETAEELEAALSAIGFEDSKMASFFISPVTPQSLTLGGPNWDFKKPFSGGKVKLCLD